MPDDHEDRLANITLSVTLDINHRTLEFLVFLNGEQVGKAADYYEAIDIAKRGVLVELLSVKDRLFLQRDMYKKHLKNKEISL